MDHCFKRHSTSIHLKRLGPRIHLKRWEFEGQHRLYNRVSSRLRHVKVRIKNMQNIIQLRPDSKITKEITLITLRDEQQTKSLFNCAMASSSASVRPARKGCRELISSAALIALSTWTTDLTSVADREWDEWAGAPFLINGDVTGWPWISSSLGFDSYDNNPLSWTNRGFE